MAAGDLIRLALVGYGKIAVKHVEVFRALGCDVVAACNRSEEGRRRAEKAGGIPKTYASISEMLTREKPEGVICCATFYQMFSCATEIMPFGIPTLLEKPVGTSLAETEQILALARKHGTRVMVGVNRRFYSILRKALQEMEGGSKLTSLFIDWSENPAHLLNNRRLSRDQAFAVIHENTIHGLDLIAHLAGDLPDPVIHARYHGEPLRLTMLLQGVSERGTSTSFTSTWGSPGRWRVTLCAPDRRYVFAPLEECCVQEFDGKQPRRIEPDEIDLRFKTGFYNQASCFREMIQTGAPPREASLDSHLPAVRLAEALTVACREVMQAHR